MTTLFDAQKIGIPNLSLSDQSSLAANSDASSSSSGRGSGYRGSIFNNVALGGSSLDAESGDSSSSIPMWVWWVVGGLGLVGALWYVTKGRK
jgi:hypothetical protein